MLPQRMYRISTPVATHYRPATCAEADCQAYARGWRTIVPSARPQAAYIRADRSRRHVEEAQEGGLVAFTFEPGQKCFAASEHRIGLDRPEFFHVGDAMMRAPDWVEDFSEHLDRIRTVRERG